MLLKANKVFRRGWIIVFFLSFFVRGRLFAVQMPGIPLCTVSPPWAWRVSWGGRWSRLLWSSGSVSKPLKAADRGMSKAVNCQVAVSSFPLVTVWRGCCSGVNAGFSHPSHFFPDSGASWFPAFVGVAVRRSEITPVTTSHTGGGVVFVIAGQPDANGAHVWNSWIFHTDFLYKYRILNINHKYRAVGTDPIQSGGEKQSVRRGEK